jgi:hypothetical protein
MVLLIQVMMVLLIQAMMVLWLHFLERWQWLCRPYQCQASRKATATSLWRPLLSHTLQPWKYRTHQSPLLTHL